MKKWITEYGHLALMCVCLTCSAVLLGSVLLDRPLVEAAETHLPVLRTAGEGEQPTEVLVSPPAEDPCSRKPLLPASTWAAVLK